ncbi:MAG: M28 family metallopeptidase [Gaiellaceae bacterium]
MRRLALGVSFVCALAAAGGTAPASASISGVAAKEWAAKIARIGPRPAGGANERRARAIVRRRLDTLGYAVRAQWVQLPNGRRSRNVIGQTPGPLRVIIVAHIDGVHGTRAANDNASGVGVLLTVASQLADKNGVLVAALGAEERMVTGSSWHLGSRRLTRSLTPAQKAGVRLALSIDMVGVGTTLSVRGLEARPNRSARMLLAAARRLGIRASYLRDTGQSDHDDLTRGGVPAAWIEWRWDRCWHQPCDTVSRLKPYRLRPAGRVVLAAARAVVS